MAENTSARTGGAAARSTRRPKKTATRGATGRRDAALVRRDPAAAGTRGKAQAADAISGDAEADAISLGAEADAIRHKAQADAAQILAEAEDHARRLVLDARASADGVRAEGMELVSNLREMSDVLRANADRLLHDIQSIHTRMIGELGQADPGGAEQAGAAGAGLIDPTGGEGAGERDALEVPDFVSPG